MSAEDDQDDNVIKTAAANYKRSLRLGKIDNWAIKRNLHFIYTSPASARISGPYHAWAADIAEGPYGPPEARMRVWQITDHTRARRGPKTFMLTTWSEAKTVVKAILDGECTDCALLQRESAGDLYVQCDYCEMMQDLINDATWD